MERPGHPRASGIYRTWETAACRARATLLIAPSSIACTAPRSRLSSRARASTFSQTARVGGQPGRIRSARRVNGSPIIGGCPQTKAARLPIHELLVAYRRRANGYYRESAESENIRYAFRPLAAFHGHTPAAQFGPLGPEVGSTTDARRGNRRPGNGKAPWSNRARNQVGRRE